MSWHCLTFELQADIQPELWQKEPFSEGMVFEGRENLTSTN